MGTAPKNLLKLMAGNLGLKKAAAHVCGMWLWPSLLSIRVSVKKHQVTQQCHSGLPLDPRCGILAVSAAMEKACGPPSVRAVPDGCREGTICAPPLCAREDPARGKRTGTVLVASGRLHGQLGMEFAWETGYPGLKQPKSAAGLSSSLGQLGVLALVRAVSGLHGVRSLLPVSCLNASSTLCLPALAWCKPWPRRHGMEQRLLQSSPGAQPRAACLGHMSQHRKERNKNKQMEEMELTHERYSK